MASRLKPRHGTANPTCYLCRFVTQEELSSLSSYMRGRLTLDKVTCPESDASDALSNL